MTGVDRTRDVIIIENFVRFYRRRRVLVTTILCCVILVLVILTGLYTVPVNETGALFLFGRLLKDDIPPGIHFKLPFPIHRVDLTNTAEIRSIKVTRDGHESLSMITGDENIILINIAVQYLITEYGNYLTRSGNWEVVMNQAALSCLTKLIAGMGVDEVLTTGKSSIQTGLQSMLQDSMTEYRSGLTIFSVTIENIQPPSECRDSFRMVSSAMNEKAERISNAQSNRNRQLSKARGEAESVMRAAQAEAEEIVKMAQGASSQFVAILREYRQARETTANDYYLRGMEEIIRKATILLVDPADLQSLDLNLFLQGNSAAAAAGQIQGGLSVSSTAEPPAEKTIERPLVTDEEMRSAYRRSLGGQR